MRAGTEDLREGGGWGTGPGPDGDAQASAPGLGGGAHWAEKDVRVEFIRGRGRAGARGCRTR